MRGSDPALAADFTRITTGMMVVKDGPDHHRLRILGNHAFTPSALRRWQSVIERVVDDLLDAALPRGRMDLIGDLARPLPAIVIAELFGIPPEDRETFHHWSMAVARFFGGAVGDPEQAARAANEATVHQERYFRDLLEERRRRPGDDLMSLLLKGQADGRLTAEEVSSQCILLLNAGHITTMDQLGNTVLALLKHPEQMGRLRDDPALVRSATEEGLRYDGAVQLLQRIAREDLMLRGQTIRKGDLVYLSLGAANRDPEVFSEPDRFDVGRSDNRHLAFGAGPHLCLGMTLARRELEVSLGRLVRRTATVALRRGAADAAACGQPGVPRSGVAAGPLRLSATGWGSGTVVHKRLPPCRLNVRTPESPIAQRVAHRIGEEAGRGRGGPALTSGPFSAVRPGGLRCDCVRCSRIGGCSHAFESA